MGSQVRADYIFSLETREIRPKGWQEKREQGHFKEGSAVRERTYTCGEEYSARSRRLWYGHPCGQHIGGRKGNESVNGNQSKLQRYLESRKCTDRGRQRCSWVEVRGRTLRHRLRYILRHRIRHKKSRSGRVLTGDADTCRPERDAHNFMTLCFHC